MRVEILHRAQMGQDLISRIHCTRILHAACQKFSLKYFRAWLKILEIGEIKDPRKFSAIRDTYKRVYVMPGDDASYW